MKEWKGTAIYAVVGSGSDNNNEDEVFDQG